MSIWSTSWTTASPAVPPPAISPKRAPQTGISRLPWAGMLVRPSIAAVTSATEKRPSCRCAMRVRSAGGGCSVGATGPSPRPCAPWQALQCRINTYGVSFMAAPGTAWGRCATARGSPRQSHPAETIPRTLPRLHRCIRCLLSVGFCRVRAARLRRASCFGIMGNIRANTPGLGHAAYLKWVAKSIADMPSAATQNWPKSCQYGGEVGRQAYLDPGPSR
jgi:hypothetical protein